jgi:serine/threonine protein kinase
MVEDRSVRSSAAEHLAGVIDSCTREPDRARHLPRGEYRVKRRRLDREVAPDRFPKSGDVIDRPPPQGVVVGEVLPIFPLEPCDVGRDLSRALLVGASLPEKVSFRNRHDVQGQMSAPLRQAARGIFRAVARDLLPIVRQALADLYDVEAEIGRGGAARVFRARARDGALVALKVLRPELTVTVTADRFLREISIVRQLTHPRIGQLIDCGQSDWLIYYAMPLIDGPTLKQVLEQRRRLSASDTVRVGLELLDALDHAHARGIVHRDIKPENVIVGPSGVVLVDFGIARAIQVSGTDQLTRSGMAVGTSRYMSPEQIMGTGDIDQRSDLYSLACVLFECAAGRPPYHHPHELAILELHRTAPIPDLADHAIVPAALAEVTRRGMAKLAADRWKSAQAMRERLSA